MMDNKDDKPAGGNKLNQAGVLLLDVEANQKGEQRLVDPVDKKKLKNDQSKEDAKAKKKGKRQSSSSGKKSKKPSSSSAATEQADKDAKAKLKGSRPSDSNAASASVTTNKNHRMSGPAFIDDNAMKPMPAAAAAAAAAANKQENAKVVDPDKVLKARAARRPAAPPARQLSTSSSSSKRSSTSTTADDEQAKAKARNQLVPSRVQRGKANSKGISSKNEAADKQAKASARKQRASSSSSRGGGVRPSGGVDDKEQQQSSAAIAVIEESCSDEDEDSILPGAQNVRGPGEKGVESSTSTAPTLQAPPPSFKKDDTPQEEGDNKDSPTHDLQHATAIVAELAPTDSEVSDKLEKMVEDRFHQERLRQQSLVVLVEASVVQAIPMGNHEDNADHDEDQGEKVVCGIQTSRNCWIFLVLGLLVTVAAVAVGAAVGASSSGGGSSSSSSSSSENKISSNTEDPLSPGGTTTAPLPGGGTMAPGGTTTPPPVFGTAAPLPPGTMTPGGGTTTAPPMSARLEELVAAIGPTILQNDPNALIPASRSSPQTKALDWLANVDEAYYDFKTERLSVLVERYVLAVLYFATNGPAWTNSYGFMNASSVCDWNEVSSTTGGYNGVVCQQEDVTEILLVYNGLDGSLPAQLGLLTKLDTLRLGRNDLEYTIPTEIGRLTSLSKLILAQNSLTGSIPSEIGRLTMLTELILVSNQLNGLIPQQIGDNLKALTSLRLEDNNGLFGLVNTPLCLQNLVLFGADYNTGCPCCTDFNSKPC